MDRRLQRNVREHPISVRVDSVRLEGKLCVPEGVQGVILFAPGNGSSRESSRNRYIAQILQKARLATLLISLLTPEEETINLRTRDYFNFNVGLLAKRLVGMTDWLIENSTTRSLNIGYFGTRTGSAAALVAAANRSDVVGAIVSAGGRPDLAGSALFRVQAPTLLLVGENEIPMMGMNQEALAHLHTEKQLKTIRGATHLFEEPGAIEEVAWLASQWFNRYLKPAAQQGSHLPSTNGQSTIERW
jgi:putative phosphoribosyl transferase